ncbi:hypothetical protein NEMBOFW57_001500 [Staphylotrichum longicolle]|uniref:Amidase domain-containing protein n=1 Tax=Staphylotrichum longicolle TaxID=669026 RepID=A0AAD4I1R4_9PEZI|nr:hypothetical protein NEMBOFW57_001500 [Staphylotrichum longicolle]
MIVIGKASLAIGLAAGFAPVSIGTETDGSIVYPATRAGLYAMKPNVGAVPLEGAMPVNSNFDVHGGFAKSPQDLADLLEIMMARTLSTPELPTSWEARLRETKGLDIVGPLELLTVEKIAEMKNGADFDAIANDGWKTVFNAWLEDEFEYSPVKNMEELVKFHEDHEEVCLPPGYAVGAIPLGYADKFNGRAFGLNVITGPHGEREMLEIMSAWQVTFPEGRRHPPFSKAGWKHETPSKGIDRADHGARSDCARAFLGRTDRANNDFYGWV